MMMKSQQLRLIPGFPVDDRLMMIFNHMLLHFATVRFYSVGQVIGRVGFLTAVVASVLFIQKDRPHHRSGPGNLTVYIAPSLVDQVIRNVCKARAVDVGS
jgi:hypothetical protein